MTERSSIIESIDEPSPLQTLQGAVAGMRGAKERIARVLLESTSAAGAESITELAKRAGTSPATVNRLSKDLGFEGYPALRAAIARERGREIQAGWDRDIGSELRPSDSPDRILQVLTGTQTRATRAASNAVDLSLLASVADAIVAARRVHVFGQWGDAVPAKELQLRLFRIGVPVWLHEGPTSASVAVTTLAEGDVAIAFSRRGDDAGATSFLRDAAEAGAVTAAITGDPGSPVSAAAKYSVFGGVLADDAWLELFAGRTTDTLVASLLWVMVAQRTPGGLKRA